MAFSAAVSWSKIRISVSTCTGVISPCGKGFRSTSGMLDPDQEQDKRKSLAEALRELRKAAGLSGERLAVRCAMSQAKISRIETGKILPSVVDVERILRALGIGRGEAEPVLA